MIILEPGGLERGDKVSAIAGGYILERMPKVYILERRAGVFILERKPEVYILERKAGVHFFGEDCRGLDILVK